jgi:hypothetical protein
MHTMIRSAMLLATIALASSPVHAQGAGPFAVEVTAGRAAFLDESPINHAVVGVAMRYALTPRLGVGPELLSTRGPGDQRTLTVTVNLTYDLLPPPGTRARAVTPFIVAGAGVFRSRDRFNGVPFSHTEGGLTGGGGVRLWISERLYVAGEVRTGWEPHVRGSATLGLSFGG